MSIAQAIKDLEDFPPVATGKMRWRRPKGGSDADLILEQEWSMPHDGGKVYDVYWATVPTMLED